MVKRTYQTKFVTRIFTSVVKILLLVWVQVIILANTNGYMCFKSDFYGLNAKNQKCTKNWCRFDELMKLTNKIDSKQSNLKI